jgi:hypothetical protein
LGRAELEDDEDVDIVGHDVRDKQNRVQDGGRKVRDGNDVNNKKRRRETGSAEVVSPARNTRAQKRN